MANYPFMYVAMRQGFSACLSCRSASSRLSFSSASSRLSCRSVSSLSFSVRYMHRETLSGELIQVSLGDSSFVYGLLSSARG